MPISAVNLLSADSLAANGPFMRDSAQNCAVVSPLIADVARDETAFANYRQSAHRVLGPVVGGV
jgi:hypothetical protein